MTSVMFAHDGEVGFTGFWTGITSAKRFDLNLIDPARLMKMGVTHWARYGNGGTAALTINESISGGTSHFAAKLVYQIVENGTAGSGDTGFLFISSPTGIFVAETLTGADSTGTVAIYDDFKPLLTTVPAKAALITVETAALRFAMSRQVATIATYLVGSQMTAGQSYVVRGWNNIKNFSAINDVGSNGSVMHYQLMY